MHHLLLAFVVCQASLYIIWELVTFQRFWFASLARLWVAMHQLGVRFRVCHASSPAAGLGLSYLISQ